MFESLQKAEKQSYKFDNPLHLIQAPQTEPHRDHGANNYDAYQIQVQSVP